MKLWHEEQSNARCYGHVISLRISLVAFRHVLKLTSKQICTRNKVFLLNHYLQFHSNFRRFDLSAKKERKKGRKEERKGKQKSAPPTSNIASTIVLVLFPVMLYCCISSVSFRRYFSVG